MKGSFAARLVVLCAVTAPCSAVARAAVRSPVERVVNLLKDMQGKLEVDEKQEQQIYDKYACWCEKTTKRKAVDIAAANDQLRALGQTILSLKGRIATLSTQTEELAADIEANESAMKKATSIRQKENGAFAAETSEMKQAIAALQQAIIVLVTGTKEESFLQASSAERAGAVVKAAIANMPSKAYLKPGQLDKLNAFVQSSRSGSKFTPQSFTVQGILTDMYKTFAADLEDSTHAEATANRQFEDLMASLAKEKQNAEVLKREKEEEKAEKEARLADTQQIYDDTTAQKEADIKFFDETKESCVSKHDAWTTRSDLRAEEIKGVKEALTILTSDDNRELFASTIKAGKETGADNSYDTGRDIAALIQVRSSDAEAAAAANAYAVLKKRATEAHSLRLAALAARVDLSKAGHFDKVILSIKTMIDKLKEEGQDDIDKRDQCKEEYQNIESKVKNVAWLIEKNVAKIDRLDKLITKRTEQRDKAVADIEEVDATKKALTEEREAENAAFLKSKVDDQKAIDVLMDARAALAKYYKTNDVDFGPIQGAVKASAFAQRQPEFEVSADQAPDADFSGKGKRKNESKGIVQILTSIIEDLDDEIKNGMKAEEEGQERYEGLIAEANALRKDLDDKRVSLNNAIAKRGEEKTDEEDDQNDNERDLKAEQDYKASIKNDCDFIVRTFSQRADARKAEMQGLVTAHEYLVGANPSEASLVQMKKPPFDDRALSRTTFLGLGR